MKKNHFRAAGIMLAFVPMIAGCGNTPGAGGDTARYRDSFRGDPAKMPASVRAQIEKSVQQSASKATAPAVANAPIR